jgi:LysM repeat protein
MFVRTNVLESGGDEMEQVFDFSDEALDAAYISFEPRLRRAQRAHDAQRAPMSPLGNGGQCSDRHEGRVVVSAPATDGRQSATAVARVKPARRVWGFVIGIVISLVAVFGAAALINAPAYADLSSDAQNVVTYNARPGDTLWHYAQSMSWNDRDVRQNVDELMALNHLDSASLKVGQRIVVPVQPQ